MADARVARTTDQIEFGVVTHAAMAFAQLLWAFSLIVVQFQSASAFAAVSGRIGSLWEGMAAGSGDAPPASRSPARRPGVASA
jgi:putative ATP-binding cassette transporter